MSLWWRYAATLDDEASPWSNWVGDIKAIQVHEDGHVMSSEVEYAVGSEGLEEGGILPFPLPMIGGRHAEYADVRRVQRPAARPNLAVFARQANGPAATAEPPQQRPRLEVVDPQPTIVQGVEQEQAENIALALRGELPRRNIITKVGTPALKIPKEVSEQYSVFYPNIWVEKILGNATTAPMDPQAVAALWKNQMDENEKRWGLLSWTNENKRWEYLEARDAFISWLSNVLQAYELKRHWQGPFHTMITIMGLIAMHRGGYNEERKAREALHRAFDVGYVNFTTVFDAIVLSAPTSQKKESTPTHNNQRTGRGAGSSKSHGTWSPQRGRGGSHPPASSQGRGRGNSK